MASGEPALGNLDHDFLNEAEVTLSQSLGYTLSVGGRKALVEIIIAGVQELTKTGEIKLPEQDKARANFAKLVREVGKQNREFEQRRIADALRGKAPEYQTRILIEAEIIKIAMGHLCPGLWPWC